MKTRLGPAATGIQTAPAQTYKAPALPCDPHLTQWLLADGSLTARLRQHGLVEVHVQQQGASALWPQERADLHVHSGYVREVVLLLNGRPAVWARSATTHRAIQVSWRAMRGLGARPLAELLFSGRQVQRAPLQAWHLPRSSPPQRHIRRQWQAMEQAGALAAMPRWARSSVFVQDGHRLRVMEAFSPWLATLVSF